VQAPQAVIMIKKHSLNNSICCGTDKKLCTSRDFSSKRELILIITSVILFVFGLIFRTKLHNPPYCFGEYIIFLSSYLISGWDVLYSAYRNIIYGRVFNENSLMTIATVGAFLIHQLSEAVGVMLFFKIGKFFEETSVQNSKKAIKTLLAIRPEYANLKTQEEIKKVSPQQVNIGDIIIVKPGEKVPLDGVVIGGSSQIDTSPLTGEPLPQIVDVNGVVLAGMINKTGSLLIKVTKPFFDTSISKILDLVENAVQRKSQTEKFITKFSRFYTPFVIIVAICIAIIPPLFITEASFSVWIYRALVLLVISCPCALVISIPLSYFGGIGKASRRGILIKGSNFIDALTKVKKVFFDKTGTLTKGTFKVTEIIPKNGFTKEEILKLAAEAESRSNHPIATAILEAYGKDINPSLIESYKELGGLGIETRIKNKAVLVGNDRFLHIKNIEHDVCNTEGTFVNIAVDNIYAGYIVIEDELKEDAQYAIQSLKDLGINQIIMLTGDNKISAERIAKELGLSYYLAELLPEEKVSIIEKLMNKKEKVAFIGDGINDAPVIARADVGIAMGGLGADLAIETADIIIMPDAPSKVAEAIKISKETHKIVWENIALALTVKGFFILLGIIGFATMWEAVFADVGVALIAIFNAIRILKTHS